MRGACPRVLLRAAATTAVATAAPGLLAVAAIAAIAAFCCSFRGADEADAAAAVGAAAAPVLVGEGLSGSRSFRPSRLLSVSSAKGHIIQVARGNSQFLEFNNFAPYIQELRNDGTLAATRALHMSTGRVET